MKIILLKDLTKIGKKNEIKEVADGFAKNYLLKKGLATVATESLVKKSEQIKAERAERSERELQQYQDIARKLDGRELEIAVKASQEGKLYASLSAEKVLQELKKSGIEINKKDFIFNSTIKEIGEHEAVIELPHNLEIKMKIILTPQD